VTKKNKSAARKKKKRKTREKMLCHVGFGF
jgi:hypothetical protein